MIIGHCLPIQFNIDSLSPTKKRILGCALAAMTGCLYGVNFLPAQYIIVLTQFQSSINLYRITMMALIQQMQLIMYFHISAESSSHPPAISFSMA